MKKITDISQIATCIDTYTLQSCLVHYLLSISVLYRFEKERELLPNFLNSLQKIWEKMQKREKNSPKFCDTP